MTLYLIPQPKQIRHSPGHFSLPANGSIGISDQSLYAVAQQAGYRIFHRAVTHIAIRQATDTLVFRLTQSGNAAKYSLVIRPNGIEIEAASVAAAFWGLQTLRQITEQSAARKLPALSIIDWPDFEDRGLYYDVCRGRVPKLERLMELADQLAHYKMNQLQLYIEHTFAFRGHPDIGKGASPLTAEDILRLDAYCRKRHVELVPSLASFGHLSTVLKHPQYHHLAEDWGKGKYVTPDKTIQKQMKDWHKRHKKTSFTLSPANPKIYQFLDSLFAEFLPLFSSDRFNACCDETYDLGYGQSYELCKKIGRGRLYLGHIIKLNDLCKKYGKRMMFWGDIIRHYPDLIPQIPKDVTLLDWGYGHNHPFARIKDFKKAGLKCYACPSTSGYVTLFPRLPQAMANIAGFALAARRHGAQGILNTDWGDGGHVNFLELTWHGYLFGADQSWNTGSDPRTFTDRFSRLFFKTSDLKLSQAINELGDISNLSLHGFYQSIWRHIFFASSRALLPAEPHDAWAAKNGRIYNTKVTLTAALGRQTLARLDWIRRVLAAHVNHRREDPLRVLPYWLFAVDTLRHAARKLAIMGPGGSNAPCKRQALKKEMKGLMRRFQCLWMARNRVSEIRITLKAYREAINAIENDLFLRS